MSVISAKSRSDTMCGLVDMMNQNQHFQVDAERLAGMRGTLAHREPDDMDLLIQGNIGVGYRRLSIVDLSPRGRQPFQDEDDSIFFILNGEIYNYVEI